MVEVVSCSGEASSCIWETLLPQATLKIGCQIAVNIKSKNKKVHRYSGCIRGDSVEK